MSNKIDIEDVLVDDSEIYNQKFFILSYILPGDNNDLKTPVIKMRGAFKTYEDAEKRIEKLKASDKFFNMYVCEVGKWGSLIPEQELMNSDEVETVYRNEELNEIFKKYKDNRNLIEAEHHNRKEYMKNKALEEGKAVFQEYLSFCDGATRNYIVPQTTDVDKFNEYKKTLKDVDGYLEFFNNLRSCESVYYVKFRDNEDTLENITKEIQEKLCKFF